jgi:DNA modification methylase
MEPVFTISCQGAGVCTLDELQELHHFKTLTDEDYVACRNNLTVNGFSFPFSIWTDPQGVKFTVDGHMRLQVIKRMRDEGATIPQEYPINLVFAKDKEEAAKKIIASESKYGDINPAEFTEFLEEYNIDWDSVEDWADIPGLDTELWTGSEVTEDEPPAVDEQNPSVSQLGEVYQLGRHRLMCGDATKIEDVEKLMGGVKADMVFTDPPYGVNYEGKTKDALTIQNDAHTETWGLALPNFIEVSKEGASYYVCCPPGNNFKDFFLPFEKYCHLACTIIWVKNSLVLGHGDYHYQHEPILYGWKEGSNHQYFGGRDQTTVWHDSRPTISKEHPTMKPVSLVSRAITNSSKAEDIILDLFGGSGSTLIACEQTGRNAYLAELDPKYCDVIRKRYAKFIGKENEWQEITPKID